MANQFNSFKEFYPFYLSQHANKTCRILHYIGTTVILIAILQTFFTGNIKPLFFIPVYGYLPAWIGHFFFEKNRPATFKYPFYSLVGDFVMYFDFLAGRLKYTN